LLGVCPPRVQKFIACGEIPLLKRICRSSALMISLGSAILGPPSVVISDKVVMPCALHIVKKKMMRSVKIISEWTK
jgi:hypothetical protein